MRSTSTPPAPPRRKPPKEGLVLVGVLAVLSGFALVTGIYDVFLPAIQGEEAFTDLRAAVRVLGPVYLFLHIFLHNLGLAALVPGIGLLAASVERDRRRRRLIGLILAVAVVLSILTAVELVVRRAYWTTLLVTPILALEAAAVLLLTWAGYRVLKDYIPTPRPEWGWIQPARELAPYVVIATTSLAFASFVETLFLIKTWGL